MHGNWFWRWKRYGRDIQSIARACAVVRLLCDERLLWRSLGLPERNDHAEPAARGPPRVVMLDHIRGGVGLQGDRTEVVAHKAAGSELALSLIVRNRRREVGIAEGHSPELPFAELLRRRQVDIDEIGVAAVEAERSRAPRDLRPVGDAV